MAGFFSRILGRGPKVGTATHSTELVSGETGTAPRLITRAEVLMTRDRDYPLTPELEKNLETLLVAVNKFRTIYGKPMVVSSGYRPGIYNTAVGGAKNSAHITCQAIDFKDADKSLKKYIAEHPEILEKCNLWMEDPAATVTWCHLSTRPVPGKTRIFKP